MSNLQVQLYSTYPAMNCLPTCLHAMPQQICFVGHPQGDLPLLPIKLPFDCGTGGQAEAQAAYEEAVDACYNLKLDSHRHAIPRISSKTGRHKWSMVEMWPMTVNSC